MAYDVTLIRGDGTGPELADVARKVLDATGVQFNWDVQNIGLEQFEARGEAALDEIFESIKRTKVAIKAPITTPVGKGFRSINVRLRKEFDCYACIRPCKTYKGVRSRYDNVDIVIFRENIEDLYAGIEFKEGEDQTKQLIEFIKNAKNNPKETSALRDDSGISIKTISKYRTERIVRAAFEYARKNNRKKVTAVHKANIMKHTDGLFLDMARKVAEEYTDIEFEDRIVDNMCMQLVQKPELYGVCVLPNLYGDLLSDLCAGLVGGLGVAPGANIGDQFAIFEATHGTAPKYTGMNKVNPTALLLSGVMMLRYLGEVSAGDRLEKAIAEVIAEGKNVTYDLKENRDDITAVGTKEMGDAIIAKL